MRWRRLAREVRLQGGGLGRGVGVGQRLEEVLVVEVVGKVLLPILKATADAQGAKRVWPSL